MNRSIARALSILGLAVAVFLVGMAGSATAAKMITGKDIKNNTVTTADIKNGTLAGKDIKPGQVSESKLSSGVKSKLNAATLAGYEIVSSTTSVPTAGQGSAYAFCPAGKVAVGGGGSWATTEFDATIQESVPGKAIGEFFSTLDAGDDATAWGVTGQHNGLDADDLTAWVVCVDAS